MSEMFLLDNLVSPRICTRFPLAPSRSNSLVHQTMDPNPFGDALYPIPTARFLKPWCSQFAVSVLEHFLVLKMSKHRQPSLRKKISHYTNTYF